MHAEMGQDLCRNTGRDGAGCAGRRSDVITRRTLLLSAVALVLAACGGGTARTTPTPASHVSPTPAPTATPVPTPTPTPLPPYAVQALRARGYPGGPLTVGPVLSSGSGFTKHGLTWVSGGQTMTGTIDIPDGAGPFPVVIVEHGYIPATTYWVGQDSAIFGDPMAAQGYVVAMPNWPGYSGSGPGPADVPSMVGELITMLDLVTSLGASVPQADVHRLACVGHSNGSGICMLAMVVDPRFRAVVLHGPVSSDMADNARKWWDNSPAQVAGIGTPDQNPTGYQLLSPRNFFAAGQPPVLIIHGTADTTCPLEWAQATLQALQTAGVQTQMVQFPGAQHDFVGQDLQQAVGDQTNWIAKALG
ncbi:MAG: alpha/beta fold hydrolase [Candidatus Dormibacteraeota bacterium]|nr:alpha/beta fold hydrolase [Candidatus Dormibacteraeota bacterium]MBO0745108.1 alpha/beta fold hydrolase [Candidatus Dormibacteraeota bacterium]